MESLKNLLGRSLRRAGAEKQVRAVEVIDIATRILADLFGDLAVSMRPTSYKDGFLKVRCGSSVCGQELLLRESEVIARMKRDANIEIKRILIQ